MTESRHGNARPSRRPRLSKPALRAWAWVAGGLAFFSPWVVLGLSPKPAAAGAAAAGSARTRRPVVIVRRITRRVIVTDAPKPAPVRYIYSGSPAGTPAAAPAPPPVTSTGGSGHP